MIGSMRATVFASAGRCSVLAVSCWIAFLVGFPFALGRSQQAKDGRQKLSDSLLVAPSGQKPNYLTYPDGREQLIYTIEIAYPAENLLSFLKTELQKRSWKPLPEDFFNPGMPSSIRRGWSFFEDHTQQPWTGVFVWSADWENSTRDITQYVLRYESPDNSTRDLKNLQVIALFIPANIAAKMKSSVRPRK
jgi:hypothetical protein